MCGAVETCNGSVILRSADGLEKVITSPLKNCRSSSPIRMLIRKPFTAFINNLDDFPSTVDMPDIREYKWQGRTERGMPVYEEIYYQRPVEVKLTLNNRTVEPARVEEKRAPDAVGQPASVRGPDRHSHEGRPQPGKEELPASRDRQGNGAA